MPPTQLGYLLHSTASSWGVNGSTYCQIVTDRQALICSGNKGGTVAQVPVSAHIAMRTVPQRQSYSLL